MAKAASFQNYPRINEADSPYHGYLDERCLYQHIYKMSKEELRKIIIDSIENANKKSSRVILNIPEGTSEEELKKFFKKQGRELFKYFQKYCGDPASTAYACLNKHYTVIAKEQFRNRTLQKERMNSGWRYQYIAKSGAIISKRFLTISDIGTTEADFNATIAVNSSEVRVLSIYVSVKNRTNTMGGQDWPKAIYALEEVARNDKNRISPYLCVFGIAMDKGQRIIKNRQQTKTPYSVNTEVWLSDFFWPFFTNYSYEDIIKAVLDVLLEVDEQNSIGVEIPKKLLDAFGECCKSHGLLDSNECFNDAYKLVNLFVGKGKKL